MFGHAELDSAWLSLTRNDPEWPGMTRNDPEWPGMTRNDPEWPRMTRNYPGWPGITRVDLGLCRNSQEWPEMAYNFLGEFFFLSTYSSVAFCYYSTRSFQVWSKMPKAFNAQSVLCLAFKSYCGDFLFKSFWIFFPKKLILAKSSSSKQNSPCFKVPNH